MDPVCTPLARVWNVNLVSKGLAVGDTALGDGHGTIIPSRLVRKHPMVVERTGYVKIVGRMHEKRVIDADRNWRGTRSLHKDGKN